MATLSDPVSSLDHARGRDDAPVTIIEYGDYECVVSGYAYYAIKQIMIEFEDDVKFVFRNFPLTQIRPNALPAALAAEAAEAQERFWEMHEILFEYQEALEPEHLLVYAQVIGLDLERFIMDMTSDKMAARIRHDFVSGIRNGIESTPALFVNGRRYNGSHADYESLRSAVEKEVASVKKRSKQWAANRK